MVEMTEMTMIMKENSIPLSTQIQTQIQIMVDKEKDTSMKHTSKQKNQKLLQLMILTLTNHHYLLKKMPLLLRQLSLLLCSILRIRIHTQIQVPTRMQKCNFETRLVGSLSK